MKQAARTDLVLNRVYYVLFFFSTISICDVNNLHAYIIHKWHLTGDFLGIYLLFRTLPVVNFKWLIMIYNSVKIILMNDRHPYGRLTKT